MKISIISIVSIFCFLFSAESVVAQNSNKDLTAFFKNLKAEKFERAYKALSSKDKVGEEQFVKEFQNRQTELGAIQGFAYDCESDKEGSRKIYYYVDYKTKAVVYEVVLSSFDAIESIKMVDRSGCLIQ